MAQKRVPEGTVGLDRGVSRRDLLGIGVAGAGAILLADRFVMGGAEAAGKTDVWVFHGTDKKKLMDACLKEVAKNGGFGKDAKKLTLKVNCAWWRTAEEGANTNPELVDAFLKGCKDQGIKEMVMPENPVDPADKTFPRSGLLDVAKSNGVPMINLGADQKLFQETQLPKAQKLKTALVGKHFLETDALVNMPVAKHHGGARLTMAMKNWMGAVWDRGFWHRNNLHQCIADFNTFIRPTWTIIDATRIMLDRGPKGPSKNMKTLDLLIVSKDPVAADVYTSALFPDVGPDKVGHLKIAAEMKIGTVDLAQMAIHKIEVS